VPRRAITSYGTTAEHDHELGLDTAGIRERVRAFAAAAGRRAA